MLFIFLSSKRRKNDEISKAKRHNDDDIEEGESTVNDTKPVTNNTEANEATTTKRVPLSLEEMIEKNKKEQEAISKVIFRFDFVC